MPLSFLANRIRWPCASGESGPCACPWGRSLIPLAYACRFFSPWQMSGHVTQSWPRRLEGTSTGGRKRTSGKVMFILKNRNSLSWSLDRFVWACDVWSCWRYFAQLRGRIKVLRMVGGKTPGSLRTSLSLEIAQTWNYSIYRLCVTKRWGGNKCPYC